MTVTDEGTAPVPEPPRTDAAGEDGVTGPPRRSWGPALAFGAAVLVLVALLFPSWRRGEPFYDDFSYQWFIDQDGFFGPVFGLHPLIGLWRVGAALSISVSFLFQHHLWVVRLGGALLHAGVAVLAYQVWRRLGGSVRTGRLVLGGILLYPLATEAMQWPANINLYPMSAFVALGGAALALRPGAGRLRLVAGGALLGAAPLFHEQVFAVAVLLAAVAVVRAAPDARRYLVPATVVPLALFAYSLTTIPKDNPRFASGSGVALGNILTNVSFVWDRLRLLTPAGYTPEPGEIYWSTRNVHGAWALVALGLGAALCGALFTFLRPGAERGSWRVASLLLGGSLVALAGTIAPILMPSAPWFTARIGYLTNIALVAVVASVLEVLLAVWPGVVSRAVTAVVTVVAVLFGSLTLNAEARATGDQLENDRMGRQLLLDTLPAELVEPGTMVLLAAPNWSVTERPVFGEHMIGLTGIGLRISLALARGIPLDLVHLDYRGDYFAVCQRPDGTATVSGQWAAGDPTMWKDIRRLAIVLWSEDRWVVQDAEHPRLGATAQLPACPVGNDERVAALIPGLPRAVATPPPG